MVAGHHVSTMTVAMCLALGVALWRGQPRRERMVARIAAGAVARRVVALAALSWSGLRAILAVYTDPGTDRAARMVAGRATGYPHAPGAGRGDERDDAGGASPERAGASAC